MRAFMLLLLAVAVPVTAQSAPDLEPFAFIVETVQVCRTNVTAQIPPSRGAGCSSARTADVNPQGTVLWMLGEVTIPPTVERSRVPMALLMQGMASTAIYWDGQRIGASGVVSATAADEVPGRFVHVVPLRADELRPGVHRIAVHLSSHRGPVRVEAPVHVLALAPLEFIRSGIGGGTTPTLVALGALILGSLYFIAVAWSVAPRRDAALVAALIACALVQGGAELWRELFPITYVTQIWRLLVILLAATALGACLVTYTAARFARRAQRRLLLLYALVVVLTVAFIPSFDARTFVVLGGACLIALAVVMPAAWRGVPGSRAIATVLVGLCVAAAVTPGLFLDRDLFVGVSVLAMVAMMDQLTEVRRVQRAATEARQSIERLELELQRQRLTPHWLLNMLNAVTAWIEEEPATAVRMVGLLGDEFRRLADPVDAPLIPIREELAACSRLLELMSLRSGRTFTLDDRDVSLELEVPPGVLHTLVENALTHGQYRGGATFTVRQVAEPDGGTTLAFDAPMPDPSDTSRAVPSGHRERSGDGFGLTYVRARLTAAFGASGTLTDGPRLDGGWRTVLRLGEVSA